MEDGPNDTPNSSETKSETFPETSSSSDFEFGSLTPSSPSQDPFSENSPADYLFLNGRLLPHYFPTSTTTTRSVSRTTSVNTFRSNSTSSRSSDSSSPTSYTPRTSTCNIFKISTGHEKESNVTCFGTRSSQEVMVPRSGASLLLKKKTNTSSNKEYYHSHHKSTRTGKTQSTSTTNKIPYLTKYKRRKATEIVTAQLYGSYTRRWQYITPVYKREGSVKSKRGGVKVGGWKKKKKKTAKKMKKAEKRRRISKLMIKWWTKILKAVVFACRECHAMESQVLVDNDVVMNKKIIN